MNAVSDEQRKKNLRLGLILATVAAVFFLGFLARMVLLGK
jgi:predicted tellurium resistance membrane protein TerC